MALLRTRTWIDGHTGAVVSGLDEKPHEQAVRAESDVYTPGALPGLEGLPAGVTLLVETHVDLRALRLDRGSGHHDDGCGYAYTYHELKAAFAHPDVTREQIATGTEPPERGRRLALYDAIAAWIAYVEREWRDRAPGEAMVGWAEDVLEPVLLDLYGECLVSLSHQCREWVKGSARRIPESAAREAERCLRAALDAYATALQRSLDEQLAAIGEREGVQHWFSMVEPPREPNALLCACRILDSCYDDPRGGRVLWRPVVGPASCAERVRVALRSHDSDTDAVTIEIDSSSVDLVIAGERTAFAHDADIDRLRDIGESIADRVRATVTEARKKQASREA